MSQVEKISLFSLLFYTDCTLRFDKTKRPFKHFCCVHNSPLAHILHFQHKPHKYNNQMTIELTSMYKVLHLQ